MQTFLWVVHQVKKGPSPYRSDKWVHLAAFYTSPHFIARAVIHWAHSAAFGLKMVAAMIKHESRNDLKVRNCFILVMSGSNLAFRTSKQANKQDIHRPAFKNCCKIILSELSLSLKLRTPYYYLLKWGKFWFKHFSFWGQIFHWFLVISINHPWSFCHFTHVIIYYRDTPSAGRRTWCAGGRCAGTRSPRPGRRAASAAGPAGSSLDFQSLR